jgi:hypothetical protein
MHARAGTHARGSMSSKRAWAAFRVEAAESILFGSIVSTVWQQFLNGRATKARSPKGKSSHKALIIII